MPVKRRKVRFCRPEGRGGRYPERTVDPGEELMGNERVLVGEAIDAKARAVGVLVSGRPSHQDRWAGTRLVRADPGGPIA